MSTTRRLAREAALWTGATLGSLCLLSLLAGWALGVTPLVFGSGSMSPAYDAGALGIAREVPAAEVAVGDVVSVSRADGGRVTHRVVAVERRGSGALLSLRGDANAAPDPETYAVTSVDRVVAGVPVAGYVLNAAASPLGLLVTVLAVGSLLWLGFSGGDRPAPRRRTGRVVLPVGIAGVLAAGVGLGAAGQVPWAFTSAYWTDTATATTTATTPAPVSHAQPTCTDTGANGRARLTWTDVSDLYKYVWEVRRVDNNTVALAGGTLGGATTVGQTVVLEIPDTSGGAAQNANYNVIVTTQLLSDSSVVGSSTSTPIHRDPLSGGNNWRAYCGFD